MSKNKILIYFLAILFYYSSHNKASAQQTYHHVFNPMSGFVNDTEKPLRDELCLNGKWQFMPVYETDMAKFTKPESFTWETVSLKVPSPWNVNSFAEGEGGDFLAFPSYPKAWEKAQMGWMKKDFTMSENWIGKQIKLHFEAIAGFAKIYVNGQLAGENLDIFFPTEFDVTSFLKKGTNEVLVGVAKASLTDDQGKYGRRNYVAGSFWGQHIAGIWQDVSLIAIPELSISDVFVQPDVQNDQLAFSVSIKNGTKKNQSFSVNASIRSWEKPSTNDVNGAPVANGVLKNEVLRIENDSKIELKAGDSIVITLSKKVNGSLKNWSPESPNLYGAIISLDAGIKAIADTKYTRFGWRQFSIKGTELLLNGKPIVLKGDSWHFMGIPQMTRRYAWAWFTMLKDANANAVRLHAQPYPSFYLDMADEMGICVLDETGIWSSDGGPKMDSDAYWNYCKKHVKSLVMRDRNHPAVFGWSVCNETLPVAIFVLHAPESIVQRQVDEINNWVAIVKETDPTRDWISGDGDELRPTDLPTVIGHYGDENSMIKWSSEGKPWGVGETGMGYYGTPKQISTINGNRAYESQLGRMEGLATEAYNLIGKQLAHKATYASIFNIIWYGLKPLSLGLSDTSRPSKPSDGIFFQNFQEGIPGVQPERLGPYTSTVNPGYDPKLPIYNPWPLFYAVQAINAVPSKPFKIEEKNTLEKVKASTNKLKQIGYIGDEKSKLKEYLINLGISFTDLSAAKNNPIELLIIDGETAALDQTEQIRIKDHIISGGKVLVWGVSPDKTEKLNTILPYQLKLTDRKAHSFLVKNSDELLANLENKDFYFSEMLSKPVMNYGLNGALGDHAKVLVEACNTDWNRWNGQAEYSKTAAVYRSEQESTPLGAAIIKVQSENANIYISSINFQELKSEGEALVKLMLTNLGVVLKELPANSLRALSENGNLERAILIKESQTTDLAKMGNQQFIDTHKTEFHPEVIQANAKGMLDFGRTDQASISFWVFSPRSLINLLVEPDMPKLDLVIDGAKETKVYINGGLFQEYSTSEGSNRLGNVPLEKGWNHIFITINHHKENSDRKTRINFESNNAEFFGQLKSLAGQ